MIPLILVTEIKQVATGFIVKARWPYGDKPGGYGEVICKDLEAVFNLIEKCAYRREQE